MNIAGDIQTQLRRWAQRGLTIAGLAATAWTAILATTSISLIAGCMGPNDSGAIPPETSASLPAGNTPAIYVATDQGDVGGLNASLTQLEQIVSTGVDGAITVSRGWLYQAGFTSDGSGQLRGIYSIATRGARVSFDSNEDVQSNVPTLVQPAGLTVGAYGHEQIIADAEASNSTGPALHLMNDLIDARDGTVSPVEYLVLTQRQLGAPIWSTVYVVPADRLFATRTDGKVLVFEHFFLNTLTGTALATRTITPGTLSGGIGTKTAKNLHGIAYDKDGDVLYVADVGTPNSAGDGAIYVFKHASLINDSGQGTPVTVPDRVIRGANSRLGDPDSLAFSQNVLAVADSASGQILEFNNAADGDSGDVAPDLAVTPLTFGLHGVPISVAFLEVLHPHPIARRLPNSRAAVLP